MQSFDYVYIDDNDNNTWGYYSDKNVQSLASVAAAFGLVADHEELL